MNVQEIINEDESDIQLDLNHIEEPIIALALDEPQFFQNIIHHIKPDWFKKPSCQYIVATLLNQYENHKIIPTRNVLKNIIRSQLTTDDDHDAIESVVDKVSDERDIVFLKEKLRDWCIGKIIYQHVYNEEAMLKAKKGDMSVLLKAYNEANKVVDIGKGGLWVFQELPKVFQNEENDKRTTGFLTLDRTLNNGGPSPKEVVCYLAPTNVGKSIVLCQTAIKSLQGNGPNGQLGQNVMLITFELSAEKTAKRCIASLTGIPVDDLHNQYHKVMEKTGGLFKYYNKSLYIHEYAPDECSVDHISGLIDNLKRNKGFVPDVLVIDYLDLMNSRNSAYNKDDYIRLKHVATEIRGLAKNSNTLIYTATQTNRTGAGDELIDLTKTADSFGKQFALDYVVSINQTPEERLRNIFRFYVAKNRNGPRNITVHCDIDYPTMQVRERV